MSENVSPNNEQFIAGEIAAGSYSSRGEALDAAVDMLRARRELIDRVAESRRQLDEGEFVEFDDEGLIRFFDELKARAQAGNGTRVD